MKPWILLIVLAMGLTAAATIAVPFLSTDSSTIADPGFAAPSAAPDGPEPVAEVEGNLTHMFGVMAQDTEGKHGWTFKNTGPGTLELRNLGTDCSCTVAQLGAPDRRGISNSMLEVKAGTTAPIELTWNTRQIDGHYKKTARIGTNDSKHPVITLAVEGQVYPPLKLYPPEPTVSFGTVGNDEEHAYHIALYSLDRPETKILRMVSSNPEMIGVGSRDLTPEEAKGLKATSGYSLDITLKKSPNLGAFAEEVVVETDHPRKPKLELKIVGRVTGPISMIPERAILREVTSSDGGSRDLILSVRGRDSVQFVVDKKPPGVEVTFAQIALPPGGKGSRYKMTIKVIPGTPSGKIDDTIVLKTDHPAASEVRVPVDILIQAAN